MRNDLILVLFGSKISSCFRLTGARNSKSKGIRFLLMLRASLHPKAKATGFLWLLSDMEKFAPFTILTTEI